MHEVQLVRWGMMVVGEAGSGKSANLRVLSNSLTQLHKDGVVDADGYFQDCQRLLLNPKSISAGELYGELPVSRRGACALVGRACPSRWDESNYAPL